MTNYARLSNWCQTAPYSGSYRNTRADLGFDRYICPQDSTASPAIAQSDLDAPVYIFILYANVTDSKWGLNNHPWGVAKRNSRAMVDGFSAVDFSAGDSGAPRRDTAESMWEAFCNFTRKNQSCHARWCVYIVPGTNSRDFSENIPEDYEMEDCAEGGQQSPDNTCNDGTPTVWVRDCNNNCVPNSFRSDGNCHDGTEQSHSYTFMPNLGNDGGYGYANFKCETHSCSYFNCTANECCGEFSNDYFTAYRNLYCNGIDHDDGSGCLEGRYWLNGCPDCDNGNNVKFIPGRYWGSGSTDQSDQVVNAIYEDVVVNVLGKSLPDENSTEAPWTDGQIRVFNIHQVTNGGTYPASTCGPSWSTIKSRVADNLVFKWLFNQNGVVVDGNFDSDENKSNFATTNTFHSGLNLLFSVMSEVMPGIVGDGNRPVPTSQANNHVIIVTADGGCFDSSIDSGSYFGDLDDTQDLLDEFEEKYPGGKIHIQLVGGGCNPKGYDLSTDCEHICCGCTGLSDEFPGTVLTCDDGSTLSRDNNKPSNTPSAVKVCNMGILKGFGDGSTALEMSCECSDSSSPNHNDMYSDCPEEVHVKAVDMSDNRMMDYNEYEFGHGYFHCSMYLFDEWERINFPSGLPEVSTVIHSMGGAMCQSDHYGGTAAGTCDNCEGHRMAKTMAEILSPYLGSAFAGHGMDVDYDAFNYPNANWIDMLNMALENILGRGVSA